MKTILMVTILGVFLTFTLSSQTAEEYYYKAYDLKKEGLYDLSLAAINKSIELDSMHESSYTAKALILFLLTNYDAALNLYEESLERFPNSRLIHHGKGIFLGSINESELAIESLEKAKVFAESDSILYILRTIISENKRQLGKYEEACKELKELYNEDSTNIRILISLGNVFDDLGNIEESLKYIDKAIILYPEVEKSYINKGFLLQRMEKYEESIKCFDKAILIDKHSPMAYSNRSFSKFKQGEYNDALKDINFSLELYPVNSYAYKIRGQIYLKLEKNEKACNDFDEALRLAYTKYYGNEVKELKSHNCN